MHRSVYDLEMVGWLVPVARYAGLAEWLPAWNRNGDVHRDTEPYLHWNALCESHWVSRSMDQSNIQDSPRIRLIQGTTFNRERSFVRSPPLIVYRVWSCVCTVSATSVLPRFITVMSISFLLRGYRVSRRHAAYGRLRWTWYPSFTPSLSLSISAARDHRDSGLTTVRLSPSSSQRCSRRRPRYQQMQTSSIQWNRCCSWAIIAETIVRHLH